MTITPKNDRLRKDIATCVQVSDALIPYLLPRDRDFGDKESSIDKEVATSAEATFIGVCNKLDDLVAGLGTYELETKFEKLVIEGAEADIVNRRQQALTAKNLRRPSVIYHPEIAKTETGAWCAYYGDLTQPEACVIGVGDTVENAMLDFDADWIKKATLHEPTKTTQSSKSNTLKGRKKP